MKKIRLISLLIVLTIISFNYGWCQIDVKGKVKDKTNDRANEKTDNAIDKGLDKIEQGVGSIFKKKDKKKKEEKAEETQTNESNSDAENTEPKTTKPKESPKLESFSKYDFVAGDQILYFEDFEQDNVGDYPALWSGNGSGEVKKTNLFPGKWFHMVQEEMVATIQKDFNLPENFIFEMDFIPLVGTKFEQDNLDFGSFQLTFYDGTGDFLDDALYPGTNGVHVYIHPLSWEVKGYAEGAQSLRNGEGNIVMPKQNVINHMIVWVQKSRLRIYFDGKKTVDLPSVIYHPQTKFNRFRISTWGCTGSPMMKNLKITTAAPDTRSKLLTEGKLISYGIYFDSGKDVVKPESYGAINDIAKVLKENPTVKIKIVGHTDSDGDDATNLDLSKRRAASVKASFIKDFGIEASRIETDGKGETQTIAPNATSEGKAKNRRVEFIKL